MGVRNRRSREAGTFLVLSVLFVSSFAERAGDHDERRSTITGSVSRLGGLPASNAFLKTGRHQRDFDGASLATDKQAAAQRPEDLAVGNPILDLDRSFSDFAQRDFSEVEQHIWVGGNYEPTWTNGAIETLPPSFDGARFNFTPSLSGLVEVVLPFGKEVAEQVNKGEFGNEFRVFGSLTMKF